MFETVYVKTEVHSTKPKVLLANTSDRKLEVFIDNKSLFLEKQFVSAFLKELGFLVKLQCVSSRNTYSKNVYEQN